MQSRCCPSWTSRQLIRRRHGVVLGEVDTDSTMCCLLSGPPQQRCDQPESGRPPESFCFQRPACEIGFVTWAGWGDGMGGWADGQMGSRRRDNVGSGVDGIVNVQEATERHGIRPKHLARRDCKGGEAREERGFGVLARIQDATHVGRRWADMTRRKRRPESRTTCQGTLCCRPTAARGEKAIGARELQMLMQSRGLDEAPSWAETRFAGAREPNRPLDGRYPTSSPTILAPRFCSSCACRHLCWPAPHSACLLDLLNCRRP